MTAAMAHHGRDVVRRLALPLLFLLAGCSARDAESVRRGDSTEAADRDPPASGTSAAAPGEAPAASASDAPARAPAAGDVEYFTAALLAHVADSLARGTTTGHMLGAGPTVQYLQIRRAASGVPEVHDRWMDVTMVQAGRGTLRSGGRVSGAAMAPGGEHRGGTIEGGSVRPVSAGDLMVIPAGVPHQYEIARGDSLRYVTVKVLAAPR